MTDTTKLAERIEALEGPCRRIDECIQVAISGKDPLDYDGPFDAPEYTASLDAAMTLVPEGWLFDLYNLNGYPEAHLTNDTLQRVAVSVVTATPALALCAAAIRAQQEAHNG